MNVVQRQWYAAQDMIQVPAHYYKGLPIGRVIWWIVKHVGIGIGWVLLITLKVLCWVFPRMAKLTIMVGLGVLYIFLATVLGAVGGLKVSKN